MLNLRSVFYIIGLLLLGLSAAMLVPCIFDLLIFHQNHHVPFAFSSIITGVFGGGFYLSNRDNKNAFLGMREAFLVTALSWFILTVFAGLPLYWGVPRIAFIDAFFESVSALTTTGSTILVKIDRLPQSILLWRSILQWLGGTGIIVIAMTIFPALRIGGMQLFRSEFSDKSEKILPRVSQIAASIIGCYTFFTVFCAILLNLAGMNAFDAICHAMTTISTGGLSTKDASIAFYHNGTIELIVAVFMIIGGITLILFVKMLHGDFRSLFQDRQVRLFLLLILFFTSIIALWQMYHNNVHILASWRHAFFNVVSVITSTGFASSDYSSWGSLPSVLFFIMCFVGGCTGSTTGGIKIFRFQVIARIALSQLRQLRKPLAVNVPHFNGHKITDVIATSVFTFISFYLLTYIVTAALLALCGLDYISAISGAASSLGNVGPGIGHVIGPTASFANLATSHKIIMMIAMIMGRLELLTVVVLLVPSFWRD
jgi:trk system potassium uptake protein